MENPLKLEENIRAEGCKPIKGWVLGCGEVVYSFPATVAQIWEMTAGVVGFGMGSRVCCRLTILSINTKRPQNVYKTPTVKWTFGRIYLKFIKSRHTHKCTAHGWCIDAGDECCMNIEHIHALTSMLVLLHLSVVAVVLVLYVMNMFITYPACMSSILARNEQHTAIQCCPSRQHVLLVSVGLKSTAVHIQINIYIHSYLYIYLL